MVLKLFINYCSQPSRSLSTFLKSTSIDHEIVLVDVFKGEHKSPKFASSLQFGTVPAITEDDFCLSECEAIFRYLATTYASKVPEYWYPAEPRVRAKVDEYMSYHHTGVRSKCIDLFVAEVLLPTKPTKEKQAELEKGVADALDKFEKLFLSKGEFIAGKGVTFADLLAVNEFVQLPLLKKDFISTRPKVKAYIDRVVAKLNPIFDEDMQELNEWIASIKSK